MNGMLENSPSSPESPLNLYFIVSSQMIFFHIKICFFIVLY